MRKTIMIIFFALVGIFTVFCVITIAGRTQREASLSAALDDAVEASIESLAKERTYQAGEEEQFLAAFQQDLLARLGGTDDENFKLTVIVTGVDAVNGMLSVRVTEEYTNPNGEVGTVSCEAAAVLEIKEEAPLVTVTYMADGGIYKAYTVEQGDRFPVCTTLPEGASGWTLDGEQVTVFPETAQENVTYMAK